MTTRVIFLCTGNSCRSQMAEGYARHLGQGLLTVYSAGLEPHGLNPLAVQVMAEDGIDITGQTSDSIDADLLAAMDLAITLCGDADAKCPVTPPAVRRLHWPLPDPARAEGSAEQVLAVFRAVRDEVRRRVGELVAAVQRGEGGTP